jgi:tetratricopeptide (TPR) repeat protein
VALEAGLRWPPEYVPAHRLYQELHRASHRGHVVWERYRDERRRHPDSARAVYLFGRLLPEADAQEAAFRRTIRLDPSLSWGHHGLATLDRLAGRLDDAREGYRRAMALAPGQMDHALGLAETEREAGDVEAAAAAARKASEIDPTDPRPWALLARLRELDGDARGALGLARRAYGLAPESGGYRRAWRTLVLAHGGEKELRAALRIEGERLRSGEDAERRADAGLYRIRLGDLEGGAADLRRALDGGADRGEVARPLRLALVRLGRYAEALRVDEAVAPRELRRAPGNVLGPLWRALEETVARRGATRVELGEAMAAVGWLEEAAAVYRRALVERPDDEAARRGLGRVLAMLELLGRLRLGLARGYRDGGDGDLDAFLEEAEGWVARLGFEGRPSKAARRVYPFLGELVDGRPGRSDLHDLLLRYGHGLVLGQRSGRPVEGLLGEAVAVELDRRVRLLSTEVVYDRLVLAHVRVGTRRTADGSRDYSGAALEGFSVLNLDEIRERPYGGRLDEPVPVWRPSDPADRASIHWPGGLPDRLARDLPTETRAVRLDVVLKHEEGHLLDAARYLPVLRNPFEGLGLLTRSGFSPSEIEAWLEGNAQLVAMAEAREPRAALHGLVALGIRRDAAPPHSRGYHDVLRELVARVGDDPGRYGLDPEKNLLQQLHLLGDEDLRKLARSILEERGLR